MPAPYESFATPTLWAPMPDQSESTAVPSPTLQLANRDASRGEGDAAPLASLVEGELAERFVSWRGASGRRYVFSVYPAEECPAYCRAILLAIDRDDRGRRRILAAFDTGIFPEPVLARAASLLTRRSTRGELHLHLLADDDADRFARIHDLVPGAI